MQVLNNGWADNRNYMEAIMVSTLLHQQVKDFNYWRNVFDEMKKAGLKGKPEIHFIEQISETSY